ncbi:hypothetical protein B566_EDAN006292 [Ephemera danica]|nr:hypothetical protein B566_EDAN006292 [Ephemera danica]
MNTVTLAARTEDARVTASATEARALHSVHRPSNFRQSALRMKTTNLATGADYFWNVGLRMPIQDNPIVAWKFCLLLHKVLREGHPNVLTQSQKHKSRLADLGKLWSRVHDAVGLQRPKGAGLTAAGTSFAFSEVHHLEHTDAGPCTEADLGPTMHLPRSCNCRTIGNVEYTRCPQLLSTHHERSQRLTVSYQVTHKIEKLLTVPSANKSPISWFFVDPKFITDFLSRAELLYRLGQLQGGLRLVARLAVFSPNANGQLVSAGGADGDLCLAQ